MPVVGHAHVGGVYLIRMTARQYRDGPVVPITGPITFRLRRPDGTTFDVDADLTTDGDDGQAEYLTTGEDTPPADLDQAGTWKAQAKEDGPWWEDVVSFVVLGNLAEPAS